VLWSDSTLELVVNTVLLVVGVIEGRSAAGVAIAAAPLVSLFVVPWALGRHVRRTTAQEVPDTEITLAHGLGFAGAVLVVMASEQAILNSGVLIVKAETGDDGLAALIFAVHPLQLEAVTLAIQRKTVLSGALFFASSIKY